MPTHNDEVQVIDCCGFGSPQLLTYKNVPKDTRNRIFHALYHYRQPGKQSLILMVHCTADL